MEHRRAPRAGTRPTPAASSACVPASPRISNARLPRGRSRPALTVSLADLCLVRMSELFPRHSVITVDRTDFGVYRRNKRDVIPIVCPPCSP